MTIKKYKTIAAENFEKADGLDAQVQKALDEGWTPFESPYTGLNGGRFFVAQAMVVTDKKAE